MKIFDLDDEVKPVSVKPATPAATEPAPNIRKMSGYDGIASVREAASSTPEPVARPLRQSRVQKEAAEAAAKEEKRLAAMAVIGTQMMKEVAEIPYSTWAFLAQDPELRLSPDEAKELAESYYLMAQAIGADFSGPWSIGFTIIMQNLGFIGTRLKLQAEKKSQRPVVVPPDVKLN